MLTKTSVEIFGKVSDTHIASKERTFLHNNYLSIWQRIYINLQKNPNNTNKGRKRQTTMF